MDDPSDLKYWLALRWVDGLGNIGIRALLDAFASPRRVFEAPVHMLRAVPGIGPKTSAAIRSFGQWQKVEKEIERAHTNGVSLITFRDPLFPRRLKNIYDCPVLLYVKGSLLAEDIPLAIVGSRRASAYGKFSTEKLARELALKGLTVVSGMARGIDTSAHKGALSVRGRTIAVLGSGIDVIYPPENRELYSSISECGAVISEFPFGTPPNAPNFPARNRIISGMSLGVVVAEATDKSGSLITAQIALEQGREVFAIPGSIDAPGSRGPHRLIREGATLVEGIDDILFALESQFGMDQREEPPVREQRTFFDPLPGQKKTKKEFNTEKLGIDEQTVYNLVSAEPVHIDAIIQSSRLAPADVLKSLLTLELHELIRQMPGKLYIREEGTLCPNH